MLTIDINRKIELSEGALEQPLGIKFISGDKQAHRINAELYRGGKPAGLSGATVLGRFLRADGATVEVQGQVTGNVASVTFDATCYAVPGRLDVSLQLTQSGVITTPLILHAMIRRGATNVIVDPGNIISDLSELLEMIDDMDSAREAAAAATETALEAAGGASQAAGTAIASAEAADTAADGALGAAAGALAAAQEALDAGARADGSAAKIDGMTVAASTLGAGQNATAVVSEVDGVIHIAFGIPRGDKGDKGDPGQGLDIRGTYATVEALAAAVPSPEQGWMYNVGTEPPYSIYMWDVTLTPPDWRELGQLTAPPTVHVGSTAPTGGETVWVDPDAPEAGTTGEDITVGPEDARTVAAAITQHDNTVTVITAAEWASLDMAARAALYTAGMRMIVVATDDGAAIILSLNADGGTRKSTGAEIAIGGGDERTVAETLAGKIAILRSGATPFALVRFTADVGGVIPLPTALGALYAPGANEVARFGVLPVSCGGTGRATPAGAREAIGLKNGAILHIERDSATITVEASTYLDVPVTFVTPYSATPDAYASINTTGATEYMRISISVNSIGGTVRVINENSGARTIKIGWLAVGD